MGNSGNRCLSKVMYGCLVIASCLEMARSHLQSPCPDVFQYQFDDADILFGSIQVFPRNDNSNLIRLDVQISVGNPVQGFNGTITLETPHSQVEKALIEGQPLRYKLYFPFWIKTPPRITQILVNSNRICSGPPIRGAVYEVTSINLYHTLDVSASQASGLPFLGTRFEETAGFGSEQPKVSVKNNQRKNSYLPSVSISSVGGGSRSSPNRTNVFYYEVVKDKTSRSRNPRPRPTASTTATPRVGEEVEDPPTADQSVSNICGIAVKTNALVFHGKRVAKKTHPWLAMLFRQTDVSLTFICATSLISHKHVITSAHCVRRRDRKYRPEELWVILGRENIQLWSDDADRIVQAGSTHIHPDYKFHSADSDIALIVLSEEIVFSNLIRPVCLWSGNTDINLLVKKKGTVVGWGRDESGKASTPEPRQITLPIVSEVDCLRSNPAFREITSSRTFCAGYRNNSGPCNGDSGSGLLIYREGRWTLRGMVSLSLAQADGSCDLRQYVVFTDVAKYADWIMKFLSK